MKTYPFHSAEGIFIGFEITSLWLTHRPLFRILHSVEGVTEVQSQRSDGDRISFSFQGEPYVIHEPWGDNSRYWIIPRDPDHFKSDLSTIHQAFQQYQSPFARVWAKVRRGKLGA